MTLVPPLWASVLLCTKGNRDPRCGNSSRGEQSKTSWPAGPHPRCPQLQAPLASWSPGGRAAPRGGWHFGPQASQVGPGAAAWGPPGPGEAGGAGGDCPKSQLGPRSGGSETAPCPRPPQAGNKTGGGVRKGSPRGVCPGPRHLRPRSPRVLQTGVQAPSFLFFIERTFEQLQGARHHARSFPWSPCINLPLGQHHRR